MKLPFKIELAHLLACVLCLLVLLLVAVVFWPQPQVSGLTIAFVRFTNAPGQPRFAVFGLTNLSHRTINFVVIPEPQIRTEGGWSEVAVAGALRASELAGGQGTNVSMALPSRGEAWRMPIIWGYDMSTAERYAHRVMNLLTTGKESPKYAYALPIYTNFSAEMELLKGKPAGSATPSQPVGSETNRRLSAAGSGR